jgi:hypothetical protein
MADIRATQSGAFEATSTWLGGVVPGSGDVAFANTFTVTISDTRAVQAISNAAGAGITVGGTFSLLNGCALTCTNAAGIIQGATTTGCVTTPSLGVGSSASLAAAFTNATTTSNTVAFSSSGTLSITGTIGGPTAGSSNQSITVTGTGTLNLTGSLTGGAAGTSNALLISGAATVNITGNLTGGSIASAFAITITAASANVTVTGNATGATSAAIVNNAAAIVTVNGTCQSSATAPAIAQGNIAQNTRLSGPIRLGASGNINPVQAQSWRWAPTLIPTYMEVAQSNGSTLRLLYTADNMPSGGYPVQGDVRQFTVYGPNDEFNGTLAVAPLSSVAAGVSQDNGVGTAILTVANVQTALSAQGLTTTRAGYLDNLSAAPPNAATVAGAVWSAATRTLTSGGGGASASEVATAVRTELGTELARLDVATSTRLASANYSAAPTTAAIRTELSTELARLDVAVSTRLSPSGTLATVTTLTNAPAVPSAAAIATQVRTELTPELARVANCSTVDTTATAIQDAVSG